MNPPMPHDEDEELSDEQIQQLLEEAKQRLITSADEQRVPARRQQSGRSIPRLQTTTNHAPYIREKDGIATADPKLLISEEQRKLAETLRPIEPAGTSQKTVRIYTVFTPSALHMRKNIPIHPLTQISCPLWTALPQ
jgi:hypothetical protein